MIFHDISRVLGSTALLPTNAKVGAVYAQRSTQAGLRLIPSPMICPKLLTLNRMKREQPDF